MKTSKVYSTKPTSRTFLRNILLLFGCRAVNWGTRRLVSVTNGHTVTASVLRYLRIHTNTHTHTQKHIYINVHIYIHTYIIHTYIHTHIYTHIHTYTYIHTHTYIHKYIYIHTYLHTYIHTYIHTQDEMNFADKLSRARQCKVPDNQSTKVSSLLQWATRIPSHLNTFKSTLSKLQLYISISTYSVLLKMVGKPAPSEVRHI